MNKHAIHTGNADADQLIAQYQAAVAVRSPDIEHLGKLLVNMYRTNLKSDPKSSITTGTRQALTESLELLEITRDVSDKVKHTLVEEERVHPMKDTNELTLNRLSPPEHKLVGDGKRLVSDRFYSKHAYGIFLPWEDEPSCVVYTAHSPVEWNGEKQERHGNQRLPASIYGFTQQEGHEIKRPRYVMFYSISNITTDLPGIRLGPILLGKLEQSLNQELGTGVTYSTLSPVRSFPEWLRHELETKGDKMFTPAERAQAKEVFGRDSVTELLQDLMPIEKRKRKIGKHEVEAYEVVAPKDPSLDGAESAFLHQLRDDLCLEFLATAKKTRRGKELVFDDVEDFHLGNGAYIGNIAMQTDQAEWNLAGGVMANYVYSSRNGNMQELAKSYADEQTIAMDSHLIERLKARHAALGMDGGLDGIREVKEPTCAVFAAQHGSGSARGA